MLNDFELNDFEPQADADAWSLVLERIANREMPPEGEPPLDEDELQFLLDWFQVVFDSVSRESDDPASLPLMRRLTNLEYENTIRDLVGIELNLVERLPQDPVTPYRFHNTAELMRIGPEQLDRYLEASRLVMASVIVDPEQPEVFQSKRAWQPHGIGRGLGADEVVFGGIDVTPPQRDDVLGVSDNRRFPDPNQGVRHSSGGS